MSICKRTVVVPAEPERVHEFSEVACEACGAQTILWSHQRKKLFGGRTEERVIIEYHHADIGADNALLASKKLVWDLCPACFEKHVQPVLDAIARPREAK
jgi:hypothetical protein